MIISSSLPNPCSLASLLPFVDRIVISTATTMLLHCQVKEEQYALKLSCHLSAANADHMTDFLLGQLPHFPFLLAGVVTPWTENPRAFQLELYARRHHRIIQKLEKEHDEKEQSRLTEIITKLKARVSKLLSKPPRTAYITLTPWVYWGSLSDFIKKIPADQTVLEACWFSFLFQSFYMLAVLHLHFPSWRHNDLHIGNVLVGKISPRTEIWSDLPGLQFHVPNHGIRIFMWDLDCSSLSPSFAPHLIECYGMSQVANRYYDLHTLCNHLLLFHSSTIPPEARRLLDDVVPLQYRRSAEVYGRLREQIEFTTPNQILLSHSYFQNARQRI